MIILWGLRLQLNVMFNNVNSEFYGANYEMLIRILHSLLTWRINMN